MHDIRISEYRDRPPSTASAVQDLRFDPIYLAQSHDDAMESPDAIETEAYPLELHYVKALFLEKEYRRCVQACRQILSGVDEQPHSHPLRDTFVRFYLALAHDELARAMHNFSQAKIPAFNQAEQLYDDALSSLPTAAECLAFATRAPSTSEPQQAVEKLSSSSPCRHDSLQSHNAKEHTLAALTHVRNDSLPIRSSPPPTSDADDLESHDSFHDIMTPTRLPKLQRDYSSMSLLQPAQKQSLMRPVRLGSPAKPYQLMATKSQSVEHRSRLPRLDTSSQHSSPHRKQLLTPSEQASPVDSPASPVSPLGSEGESAMSDTSTISPVSPDTPYASWRSTMDPSEYVAELQYYRLFGSHLQAMRTQIQSHLRLLRVAKLKTSDAQAERSLAHATNDRRAKEIAKSKTNERGLASGPSYWSFSPEDVRVVEKQNRIQAARAREWKRERFDPRRYQELADAAIAEL